MCELPFSLDVLYQAIEQQIQQHLPGVQTVSFWPDIQNHIPLPAVFLDIGEIEPGQETGSGQTALTITFEARLVVNANPALANIIPTGAFGKDLTPAVEAVKPFPHLLIIQPLKPQS